MSNNGTSFTLISISINVKIMSGDNHRIQLSELQVREDWKRTPRIKPLGKTHNDYMIGLQVDVMTIKHLLPLHRCP